MATKPVDVNTVPANATVGVHLPLLEQLTDIWHLQTAEVGGEFRSQALETEQETDECTATGSDASNLVMKDTGVKDPNAPQAE